MEQKVKQDDTIGNNLRDLRMKCGWTQEQVVAKMQVLGCSVSRSSYAKIESGICNIRVSELKILKKIYNTSWDDIFK